MKLLILGGTQFVGRHVAQQALQRGHQLTLFNRGQTNQELFPEAEKLRGDRDGDLQALESGQWDAVLDTCGYVPRVVQQSVDLLKDRVTQYCFISSISAYADMTQAHLTETASLAQLEDPSVEEVTGESYGGLKVLCEDVVREGFSQHLILRPGLIVGPDDPTDRFSYWPWRIAQGGVVLVPAPAEAPIQFIDVRDLASFILDCFEASVSGIFNLVTPPDSMSFADMVNSCKTTSASDASFVWAEPEFLQAQEVAPWMGLPLWVPGEQVNFLRVDNRKAMAQGLSFHDLGQTVKDTLAWLQSRPDDHQWRAGISLEKEQEVLAAHQARL